jgi:hypothetical protein
MDEEAVFNAIDVLFVRQDKTPGLLILKPMQSFRVCHWK